MTVLAMRRSNWPCKACRKTSFQSEGRALSAVEHYEHTNPGGYNPIRAYPCPYGNGWHVTSKQRKEIA